MHEPPGTDHPAAERLTHCLMAETDAEYRYPAAAAARIRGMEIPAEAGYPGPGEMMMPSGRRASACSTVRASLR